MTIICMLVDIASYMNRLVTLFSMLVTLYEAFGVVLQSV